MSRFYNRVKQAFRRDRLASKSYYDPVSRDEDESTDLPNRRGENQSPNIDNDYDGDAQNMRNNTRSQPTLIQQQRERSPSIEEDPPSSPKNLRNPENRPTANVPQRNIPPVTDPTPAPSGLPVNSNPKLLPSLQLTPQTSANATLTTLRNRRRRPFNINPNSELVGFSRNQNFSPAWAMTSGFTPRRRIQPSRPPPPSRRPNSFYRENHYPPENAFNNRNISPTFTIEVNEPIDYDRFDHGRRNYYHGSKPRTHRLECQLVDDSPQLIPRYIREVNYPQIQNFDNIQLNINTHHSLTCFPTPIRHFTAHALPNDPMRYY